MATTRRTGAKGAGSTTEDAEGFSAEERAAIKQAASERRRTAAAKNTEQDVLDAIAQMTGTDQQVASGLHALVRRIAPELTPRTWYGFPAYALDAAGKQIVVYFQMASKFKARYGMVSFNDSAKLDDGDMWPVSYAVTTWDDDVEATISRLLLRALGRD